MAIIIFQKIQRLKNQVVRYCELKRRRILYNPQDEITETEIDQMIHHKDMHTFRTKSTHHLNKHQNTFQRLKSSKSDFTLKVKMQIKARYMVTKLMKDENSKQHFHLYLYYWSIPSSISSNLSQVSRLSVIFAFV